MDYDVFEVHIPASVDDADAADFIGAMDVRNVVETATYGSAEMAFLPAELLTGWHDQLSRPSRLFAVRIDGRIVGRAVFETQTNEAETAWLVVEVLPHYRGRGVGGALADRVESLAADGGRTKLLTFAASADGSGERLVPPTGFGSVPADNPEVRFLLRRGWRLEQVARGSRLALPLDPDVLAERIGAAVAASGPDYAVHTWLGPTPHRWLADLAALNTRMSTDAPSAGLEEPEDIWTVERLVEEEERRATGPMTPLTAVTEHVPSGLLVGYTQLLVPAEVHRPVSQVDTLVLREHRGHRLGMLLKIANLAFLESARPGHPAVITFNAEENRPMLDVNEAVGFVPIGYEGGWRRSL